MATSLDKRKQIIEVLKELKQDVARLEDEKQQLETDLQNRKLLSVDMRRSLHWVIKIGNLEKSVAFYTKIFGMKVLRHEEFDSGCDAKCNGDFDRPWSKTMIGYLPETTNFALELTYNYGIKGYQRGNDLRFIGLHITQNGMENAIEMGYKPTPCDPSDTTNLFYDIMGPNNIKYRCKMAVQLPIEPFWSVALNVRNVEHSFKYWCGVLQMQAISKVKDKYLRASYGGQVPLEFYQLNKDVQLKHAAAQGRIAFTTNIPKGPFIIHDYIKQYKDESYVIHTPPVTLSTPGKADVDVVILEDVDGYEICFVNQNGFDDLCTTKSGDDNIDWNARSQKGADK
eukprot:128937_1